MKSRRDHRQPTSRTAGSGWVIRRGRPDDAQQASELFYHTIHAINSRDYSSDQIEAWAPENMDADGWWKPVAEKTVFVAERGGEILGFAELEPDGHIDRFYCHSKHQRCGIGSSLMNEIENTARANEISRLYTEASITARPFFERRGFETLAERQVEIRGVVLINFAMQKIL